MASIEEAGGIIAFILGAGAIVVCGLVRGLGRALEPSLWAGWGGPLTTQRLRWSGPTPTAVQRRRHELAEKVLSEALPTEAEEESNPVGSDGRYEVAVAALRDLTRDETRFKLVAEENAEYGFRRNCLGLRPVAILVALIVFVASGVLFFAESQSQFLIPAAASVLMFAFWVAVVRDGWVRSAADRYAVRLLETVESLAQDR